MYGCGCPSYGYPGYGYNDGGNNWLWIIIIVFVIFFLFCGSGKNFYSLKRLLKKQSFSLHSAFTKIKFLLCNIKNNTPYQHLFRKIKRKS